LRAGLAAMKIHLLWDFLTGSILQLGITPGRASDATNPIAQEVAPAGSLSLFDLGYFCLDRFQNLTRAGAFWISRLQHGTSVFDAQGQPLALLQYLRQQTGSGPIDVSVLLGVSHRLPCRLIALRVPQEVADRRRQKAYVKAQKHGRVPSREKDNSVSVHHYCFPCIMGLGVSLEWHSCRFMPKNVLYSA
jgi:hypothetical protein